MNKIKSKIIFYTIRIIALLALWGYIGVKGKSWLEELGLQISPTVYSWLAQLGIGIIFIFTIPSLIKALRENYKPPPTPLVAPNKIKILKESITIYRYRYTTVFIAFLIVVIFTYGLISILIEEQDNIHFGAEYFFIYAIILFMPVASIVYAIRILLYSARIDKISVTIITKGFSVKRFLLNDISTLGIKRFKASKYAVVNLFNGERYSFNSLLKNFPELYNILKEHCTNQAPSTTEPSS